METRFIFETVQKIANSQIQRPIKYVLPSTPSAIYSKLNIPKNIIKETERCPFPQVRQLIMVYLMQSNLPTQNIFGTNYSYLVGEKYEDNLTYKKQDNLILAEIFKTQSQTHKINQLYKCAEEYKKLYEIVMRGLEKDYKQQQAKLSRDAKNTSFMKPAEKLKFYQDIRDKFSQINNKVLNIENKYFEFTNYAKQFQRGLILAAKAEEAETQRRQDLKNIGSTEAFFGLIASNKQTLSQHSDSLIDLLFQWRESVKRQAVTQMSFERNKQLIQKSKNIHTNIRSIYLQINNVANLIVKDCNKADDIYQNVSGEYMRFLAEYIKVKQVQKFQNKIQEYEDVIEEQKLMFTAHLKKNNGMAVSYKLSPQYSALIKPITEDKEKNHLKQLILDNVAPLQSALQFINVEYVRQYESACQGSNIRSFLERKIEEFEKWAKDTSQIENKNKQYMYHLIESCRRLYQVSG